MLGWLRAKGQLWHQSFEILWPTVREFEHIRCELLQTPPCALCFLCLLASLSTGCSGTADACVGRMQATREYCIEVAEPRRTADGQAVYSTCWSFSRVTPRLAHKRGLLEWRTLVGSDLRVPRRLPLTLARYHVMPRSGCLLLFEYSAIIEITSQMSSGATQSARASLSLLKNAYGPA